MTIIFEKRNKLFSSIRFLAEAVSTDPTRPFMRGIRVEIDGKAKILTATDGRRLHQLTVDSLDIEAGDYTVIKKSDIATLTLAETVDFPDWRKVIPENTVDLYKGMFIDKREMEEPVYLLNRLDITMRLDFLGALNGLAWNVRQDVGGRSHAVIFESGDLKAVIMPLNAEYTGWKGQAEKVEKRLASPYAPAKPEKPVESDEKPAAPKPPVKAAKARRNYAADSQWKPTRLGTRQTMVCRF
jgi:hypothetical protein